MNAKFFEKLISFREHHALNMTKIYLQKKIQYQFGILKQKSLSRKYVSEIKSVENVQNLLLIEARAAKEYWSIYGSRLKNKIEWISRNSAKEDVFNRYANIGYHFLSKKLSSLFAETELPTYIGLSHKAQSKKSTPLVYDFMEWLRPIVVDKVILILLRKKKKQVKNISNKDIGRFINLIKAEFNQVYYHPKLKYCITLEYWTKLILLHLQKSVNEGAIGKIYFPSIRNENRCKLKNPHK